MQPNRSNQTWAGALRHVPFIIASILLFSIITLSLAAAYGKQLAQAPLSPYMIAHPGAYPHAHRWSTAYFVFYSGTMPILTILQSATDFILYFFTGLNHIYALTVSIIFLCGWAVQVGFWGNCDISGNWHESAEGTCYQANLQQGSSGDAIHGLSDGLGNAKVAFGILLLVLYMTYMSFAAAAVNKRRSQRGSPLVGMKALDSSEQEMNAT